MKLVYLESGSGVPKYLPSKMISQVKSVIDIPLIVGGGIKTEKDALNVVKAGADIIVTGTLVENVENVKESINKITSAIEDY
jgi:phosphoglycerol geranylgeranyltransferase